MQIVPMRDLKDTVSIERKCTESGEPVFVTKNGYGKLVVMDIELYQKVMKSAYEAILINESLEDVKNGGKLHNGEAVRQEIMARYAK